MLDEIADLLARHKLVPFFGAGISRRQLGFAGAGLAREMATLLLRPIDTPLSQIADDFAGEVGEAAFLNFLRSKLVLNGVDDSKVSTHRLLLSLSLRLLYTTNQDNLFELVSTAHGRPYRRIVTLNDLRDADPSEALLIKFHGDLDAPESLVFGARSYQKRMSVENHPLDIRLRSDLLGKGLLFVGYSLQDENIRRLLLSVQRAAAGAKLPSSYLLAYDYDPSMEDLRAEFGVRIIDPMRQFPSAASPGEGFERSLKELCDGVVARQASYGLGSLAANQPINSRMATEYEIESISKMAAGAPFHDAVNAFRGALDWSEIPTHLQRTVADNFRQLVARVNADDDQQMAALRAALFNLHLPPVLAIEALASVMAICNRRPVRNGYDEMISLPCPALPDGLQAVAAAGAVTLLSEKDEPVTDNFRRLAFFWFQDFAQNTDPKCQEFIKAAADTAWSADRASESPLRHPLPLRQPGFHAIFNNIMSRFPKRFKDPENHC